MRKEKRLKASKAKKKKKIIKIIVFVVFFVVILSLFYFFNDSHKKNPKVEDRYNTYSSEVAEGDIIRDAMRGVGDLYQDSSYEELKTGITTSDLKKVREKVEKLNEGNLKDELLDQLQKIQKQIE